MSDIQGKYEQRGVSSRKTELHDNLAKLKHRNQAVAALHPATKTAFAQGMRLPKSVAMRMAKKGSDEVFFLHADGAGSKPVLAYLHWRESGNIDGFKAVAEDALVMNTDDLLATGALDNFFFSSFLSRNAKRIPSEILHAVMETNLEFAEKLQSWGIEVALAGGETADVGDNVSTLLVDAVACAFLPSIRVINPNSIKKDAFIVGFSSAGQASYEQTTNSGIAANGLTSARHDLLESHYRKAYPETINPEIDPKLTYIGKHRLQATLPNQGEESGLWAKQTLAQALLSPTRTYLPIVRRLYQEKLLKEVKAIFHNTGGGLTKCLRFGNGLGNGIDYRKNNLLAIPPIFQELAKTTSAREMLQTYNCGTRLEMVVENQRHADEIVSLATAFGVQAGIIGNLNVRKADSDGGFAGNRLSIECVFNGKRYTENFTV